jgi:hypothetical protein
MRYYIFTLLLLAYSFLLCAQDRIDSVEYKYGGGVTGQTTSFRFTSHKITTAVGIIDPIYSRYKKLKKSTWKKISTQSALLANIGLTYQKPSNYYESIVIYSARGRLIYTWSSDDKELPTELHAFATLLKNTTIQ